MCTIGRVAALGATAAVQLLIGRDWFDLTRWHLTEDGRCVDCGTPLPGVFELRPSSWGRQLQLVRLQQ